MSFRAALSVEEEDAEIMKRNRDRKGRESARDNPELHAFFKPVVSPPTR